MTWNELTRSQQRYAICASRSWRGESVYMSEMMESDEPWTEEEERAIIECDLKDIDYCEADFG